MCSVRLCCVRMGKWWVCCCGHYCENEAVFPTQLHCECVCERERAGTEGARDRARCVCLLSPLLVVLVPCSLTANMQRRCVFLRACVPIVRSGGGSLTVDILRCVSCLPSRDRHMPEALEALQTCVFVCVCFAHARGVRGMADMRIYLLTSLDVCHPSLCPCACIPLCARVPVSLCMCVSVGCVTETDFAMSAP